LQPNGLHPFDLEVADPDDDAAGNLIPLPYDWRRDVRSTARRLARVAERKLAIWRSEAGTADSQIILIAHSMGGLVARYALECLGLWRSTRALITFGTPYRGAPRALDYLVNGRSLAMFGVRLLEVTEVLRSFPSAYQLLPRYPVIETSEGVKRVAEVGATTLGLDPAMLDYQVKFHRELDAAIARNAGDAEYRGRPYGMVPVIGVAQSTVLGCRWFAGALASSTDQPHWLPAELPDGDGTVPKLAAMPTDSDEAGSRNAPGLFVAQAHESLQRDDGVLTDLIARVKALSARRLADFLGPGKAGRAGELGVALADATPAGLPVAIRARAVQVLAGAAPSLEARVEPVEGGSDPLVVPLAPREDGWSTGEASGLAPGTYRATVRGAGTDRVRFGEVTTGFAVVEVEPGADGT
jgi:hypothetical protein